MKTTLPENDRAGATLASILFVAAWFCAPAGAQAPAAAPAAAPATEPLFHDAHFHLNNYIMEGTDIHEYLDMMGSTIGRSVIFGLPVQQMWSYGNTGDFAPYYYLQTDAPLYYYSFCDAQIAMAYKSLAPEQQARIDPMIIGFNPADMYAVDHIRRVLKIFPGVFSGRRRVFDPQGIRLLEDRRRGGQPEQSRARPHLRLSAARSGCRSSSTTTSTCRSRSRTRSPTCSSS